MYCVHLCPTPIAHPVASEEYHWLDVAGGQALLVHPHCHRCQQGATRLSHPLQDEPVGATVAAALVDHGVVETDTLVQAMMKVAPTWPQAWP